jgi:hypothetical protein
VDKEKLFRGLLPSILKSCGCRCDDSTVTASEGLVLQTLKESIGPSMAGTLRKIPEEEILSAIRGLSINILTPELLSFHLSTDQAFGFIEDHLRKTYAAQGLRRGKFRRTGQALATLTLPGKSVLAMFQPLLAGDGQKIDAPPSAAWQFTVSSDLSAGPVMGSPEGKDEAARRSRRRVVPLQRLLSRVLKRDWDVVLTGWNGYFVVVMLSRRGRGVSSP